MKHNYNLYFPPVISPFYGLTLSFLFLCFFISANPASELTLLHLSCSTDKNYLTPSDLETTKNDHPLVSALSSGKWFRVSVNQQGMHKVTYADLNKMGLITQPVNSSMIRLHGYSGGMLPEIAGLPRFTDLPENSIMMIDGNDGIFNLDDYFIFYSTGPNVWKFNSRNQSYEYHNHLYSDKIYYFITVGDTPGLRVEEKNQPASFNSVINYYDYHEAHHVDLFNLIKSGRSWLGDIYDLVTSREYTFKSAETEPNSNLDIRFSAAARSGYRTSFTVDINGTSLVTSISPVIFDPNSNYANLSTNKYSIVAPSTFKSLKVKYNKIQGADIGWLNFIEINLKAKLNYDGTQLSFSRSDASGNVQYVVEGVNEQVYAFDVTNHLSPFLINASKVGNTIRFNDVADTLRQYHIASSTNFLPVELEGQVINQNLHGMSTPQMLIISPPNLISEAIRLATLHGNIDNLDVAVVQPQSIYNEFSSGVQDISAIRDFIKMLWDRSEPSNLPRYVLLFGDASYDYKNRITNNTNLVPTYQSPESLNPVNSLSTDDFFVSINDNEGGNSSDMVDIGIGRLPVTSPEQAKTAVDKIIHYVTDGNLVNGDWRNLIAMVADDGDGNIHMTQANSLASMIDTTFPTYIVDKIFLDAYEQVSTPGGERSPGANNAINQRVQKGALIINYTGHGGETGWTHEQVLEVKDVNSWSNYNNLPVFMTATCEFSRYDDPGRISAGEYAFLNKFGGAIALFTTARPTYGTPNFTLAKNFYSIALGFLDGQRPRMGDIIRLSKKQSGADNNNKKFVLLGDPALTIAYPKNKIITTSINNRSEFTTPDTLKALQTVTIKGRVADYNDNTLTTFNGSLMPVVYDKESSIVTLGNEGDVPMTFNLRRNIIYKGKVNVINGEFAFSFIVPKDIAYNFGMGKISYYATDGITDATGNYSNIIIGGFSDNSLDDNIGPAVSLFMNDTNFKDGGYTDENPVLLAFLSDSSGINTIGNGIGHDIIAILDKQTSSPFILNDFYQSDENTYKSGILRFPFFRLEPGIHELKLKVWDANNNSTEITTSFVVSTSNQIALDEIEAWPNPMRDHMQFTISHNQAGKELLTDFTVYDLTGNKVSSRKKRIFASGYRTSLVQWDGRGDNGNLLAPGMYIGQFRISTPDGLVAKQSIKIVIAR